MWRRSSPGATASSASRLAGLALLCALAAGCGLFTKSELDEERARMEENRDLWRARGPASYTYVFRRICFCAPAATNPVIIQVRQRSVLSVRYEDTGAAVDPSLLSLYPTVEGLFEIIENAIDQEAEVVQASYDPTLGYPTSITLDGSSMIADDEATLTASHLAPAP
jgi:hypothetical protein